jgi:hypothetical protein
MLQSNSVLEGQDTTLSVQLRLKVIFMQLIFKHYDNEVTGATHDGRRRRCIDLAADQHGTRVRHASSKLQN